MTNSPKFSFLSFYHSPPPPPPVPFLAFPFKSVGFNAAESLSQLTATLASFFLRNHGDFLQHPGPACPPPRYWGMTWGEGGVLLSEFPGAPWAHMFLPGRTRDSRR